MSCWHDVGDRRRHVHHFADDHKLLWWGRCRSGARWFWAATDHDGGARHGWADTETVAVRYEELLELER